ETAGRPILYATTFDFLQHFGLRDVEDLPPLEEQTEKVLAEAMVEAQAAAQVVAERIK
ncbi:MAG TPA: SMC-Scp complex subunit ScpB, partial [Anaerolineae bacterium]